jgi:hypothetical protein
MNLRYSLFALSFATSLVACASSRNGTGTTTPTQNNDSTSTDTSTDTTTSTEDEVAKKHMGTTLQTRPGGRKKSTARIRIKSPKDPKKDDDLPDTDNPGNDQEDPGKAATITGVYPSTASAGSVVEIAGADFSPRAADNVVSAGGVVWEVKRVLNGRLVAVVPAKAKSGKLEIKVGKKSQRSNVEFRVMPTDAAFGRPANYFSGDWVSGLLGQVYRLPSDPNATPDFASLGTPDVVIAASTLDIADGELKHPIDTGKTKLSASFAIRYLGSLNVLAEGEYEFCLNSDDGSQLLLEGQMVVDNGNVHTVKKACEFVYLEAGEYAAEVRYFQANDKRVALQLTWSKDGGPTEIVPATALFRPEDPSVTTR